MGALRIGLALALATAASPVSSAELRTVGIVCHCRSDFPTYKAFEMRLAELGWRDGETLRIVRRFSDGDPVRLSRNAEEVVGAKPDVIFAGFTPAVVAVQRHTSSIPVVFAGVSDASEIGAASQLNRPEHNFTGPISINRELMPKRMEVLKEALPALGAIGYLANPRYALHKPQLQEMEAAAQRLGVKLVVAEVSAANDLEKGFADLVAQGAQALVVQQDPLFTGQTPKVVALAEAHRLPAIYALRGFYDQGGFMWYGAEVTALFDRAAHYVDKVLHGAKPSELPVERPSKIFLTVNMKLAERLGWQVTPAVLARADDVTE